MPGRSSWGYQRGRGNKAHIGRCTSNAFREALAICLNQEEDLEVAWQASSITDTRDVHLDGVDVALVDPFLPDGYGMELSREVSVANPNALALVLSHKLNADLYQRASGARAV